MPQRRVNRTLALNGAPADRLPIHATRSTPQLEVHEMRERLRECEPLLVWRVEDREQDPADLVGGPPTAAHGIERLIEALRMMREDLVDPARTVVEWLAVRRQDALHAERLHALERAQEIAERIGPPAGIHADVRRDPRQHVVAGDERAARLLEQHRVMIGVARRPDDRERADAEIEDLAVRDGVDRLEPNHPPPPG